jgi:hypothetical protein
MANEKRIIVHATMREIATAVRKISLSVNVRRYTTDVNGAILNDAAIPESEKKPFPFHLFGDFDRQSGYAIADLDMRNVHNTILFTVFTWGVGMPLLYFNPLAQVNKLFKKGDVIFCYVDNLEAPSYFTWIHIQSIIGGFASVVSQTNISQLDNVGPWGAFMNNRIDYKWMHDEQLNQPVKWIIAEPNAAYKSDSLAPEAYWIPQVDKSDIKKVIIPLEFICNQYFGLSTWLAYENPLLNLNFSLYV